jgi:methionyl aminopeptidase
MLITPKTPEEVEIMKACGEKLRRVKNALREKVKEGVRAGDIEELATELIKKEGGQSSFKMVPGYHWSTCVNTNDGVVHGIPHPSIVFKKGDIVSVDVGMYYKGFHTDTSFSVGINVSPENNKFLKVGEEALRKGIKSAKAGSKIYDISEAIETVLLKGGVNPMEALVGHGVGRELHEDPQIPCFTYGRREDSPEIPEGATLAIEVMYTRGKPDIYIDRQDKWTIRTKDGKISALFEETVAVTNGGPIVLT